MLIDKFNEYSDSQAVSANGASTNVIDHVDADTPNIGNGMEMVLMVQLEADAGGAGTFSADLEVATDEAFTAGVRSVGSVSIPNTAVAGDRFFVDVPKNDVFAQYSRVNYSAAGGSITVSAVLSPKQTVDHYQTHPKGYTISG